MSLKRLNPSRFPRWRDEQQLLTQVILKDPAVESLSSFIGIDGTNTTVNSGRILINLKPLSARNVNASDLVQTAAAGAGARFPGMTLLHGAARSGSCRLRIG